MLVLGRLEVYWGKNNFYTDHCQLFQCTDLKRVPYYYAIDSWPDGELAVELEEGFSKPLRHAVDRMEIFGILATAHSIMVQPISDMAADQLVHCHRNRHRNRHRNLTEIGLGSY